MVAPRRRDGRASPPPPPASLPLLLALLLLLLSTTAASAAAPPTVASSALLVLDPQPSDPCSRSPGECGTVDSCASLLRVDVLTNGTALITPAGPDYSLECATSYDSSPYASSRYSYDPRVPARGTVRVQCSAMSGRGAAGAWPPAKGGNPKRPPDQAGSPPALQPGQRRALVFDKFADPDLPATAAGGDGKKPYGGGAGDGTVSHSLLSGPDSRMTSSALFNRKAFHSALCFPFYCPTPGCFMGRPSALVVIEAPQPGSGRVLVRSAERQFTCEAWSDNYFCGRELSGFSYRVAEGSLLGESAKSAAAPSCAPGTGPAKISVPAAPVSGGGGIKAGPRDNSLCVSACDGGGKATASSSAILYASSPPAGACARCPDSFLPRGPACVACAGWQGPCCAKGGAAGCPACPAAADLKKKQAAASSPVRLRLAAIVSPRREVTCTDFFRAAAADLAAATSITYLDDDAKAKAAASCPPRELALSVNAACGVELSSRSCPMLNTVRSPDFWQAPGQLPEGQLGTLPFNLTSAAAAGNDGNDGSKAAAWAIKRGLLTRYWSGRYQEEDGNSTVVALEPNGPGGRGLLALKLNPIGCVFRFAVVEGALPGGTPVSGAGSSPLPAASRWCPGGTVKAAEPAKLADGAGEAVPVCVPT